MIQANLKFITSSNRTDPFTWTGENDKGILSKFTTFSHYQTGTFFFFLDWYIFILKSKGLIDEPSNWGQLPFCRTPYTSTDSHVHYMLPLSLAN